MREKIGHFPPPQQYRPKKKAEAAVDLSEFLAQRAGVVWNIGDCAGGSILPAILLGVTEVLSLKWRGRKVLEESRGTSSVRLASFGLLSEEPTNVVGPVGEASCLREKA